MRPDLQMSRYSPAPWTIRTEMTAGTLTHSVWQGAEQVAANIMSLADARIIQAAPELYEFARVLCVAVIPRRAHLADRQDPQEVLALCRDIMLAIAKERGKVSPPDSSTGDSIPAKRDASQQHDIKASPKPKIRRVRVANEDSRRPFEEIFKAALDQIYRDAKASGVSLQRLSEDAGISRAQFSRWRKSPPGTIKAMTNLQSAVRARRGPQGAVPLPSAV